MKVLSPVLYHDEAHEATQHIDEISQRMDPWDLCGHMEFPQCRSGRHEPEPLRLFIVFCSFPFRWF